MKVDFMLIGAQKCATSSLAFQLSQHERICFCRHKEPHYFSRNVNWNEGLEAYHKFYAPHPGQLCGEASTSYTFFPEYPHVAKSLHDYNPDLKLIYIIRNPVDRIISHYQHNVITGKTRQAIEAEIFKDPSYINRSRYGVQVRRYLEVFPEDSLLLLLFEEFVSNPSTAWEKITSFLEIPPADWQRMDTQARLVTKETRRFKSFYGSTTLRRLIDHLPDAVRNKTPSFLYNQAKPSVELSRALRHAVWLLMEDDIAFVEDMLGIRLDSWRKAIEYPSA